MPQNNLYCWEKKIHCEIMFKHIFTGDWTFYIITSLDAYMHTVNLQLHSWIIHLSVFILKETYFIMFI